MKQLDRRVGGRLPRKPVVNGARHAPRLVEPLEGRRMLAIVRTVTAGGTLDINPVASIFPSQSFSRMDVLIPTVPGVNHGAMFLVSDASVTPWGTIGGTTFAPAAAPAFNQNRVFYGQGFRYVNNGTGVGTSEIIPVRFSDGFTNVEDTLQINIVSNVGAPQITMQPEPLTSVELGQSVTLQVAATGASPLSYQWYEGLSPNTADPIPGAIFNVFNTGPINTNGQHFYWVRVSNSVTDIASFTSTVKAGHAPFVTVNGPYIAPEGGSVAVSGSATDPDHGLYLVYDWDLDGDGVFGEPSTANGDERGQNVTFLIGHNDGPGNVPITLRARNDQDVAGYQTVNVRVTNVPPTASLTTNGTPGLVSFSNQADPADNDLGPLLYSYDWNGDHIYDVVDSGSSSMQVPAARMTAYLAGQPIFGRVKDKDGGFTEYAANVHGRAILVTTLADESNSVAAYAMTAGTSLREALAFATSEAGANAIAFDPALVALKPATLSLATVGDTTFGNSAFGVNSQVWITAPLDTNGITLRRNTSVSSLRAFDVGSLGDLTLENLMLTDFNATVGLASSGNGSGGAIFNAGGKVTIRRSTLYNNIAHATAASNSGFGGAIFANGGTVAIENSTLYGNQAVAGSSGTALGGAIYVRNGVASIGNSTISANIAGDGRALYLAADNFSIITSATISNSILGQSDASIHDVAAVGSNGASTPTASGTNNLIRSPGTAYSGGNSTQDPGLLAAAFNGGPTITMALAAASPAINSGTTSGLGNTPDQRGVPRPQGAAPDVGAYERPAAAATVTGLTYEDEVRQAVVLGFSGDASAAFSLANVTLTRTTTGEVVPLPASTLALTGLGAQATITLSGLSLPNGRYRLSTSGSVGSASIAFNILAGDFNRDGKVDFSDLLTLAQNYDPATPGKTFSRGDANYDGTVDFSDLLILAQNYGMTLPAALQAAPKRQAERSGVRVADTVFA